MRAENYNRMKNVAESSGTVIFEHEGKLYIVRKPSQWTSTALFVTGLLTFIFLANGILQLFLFNKGSDKLSAAGIILSAAGVLFAFISWRIIALRKKINSLPPEKFKSICVIDLGSDNLLDENEKVLTSLSSLSIKRKMQVGSSSPKLVLCWDKKTLNLVKGNPFSGGISAV